jgi:hypothetical protein
VTWNGMVVGESRGKGLMISWRGIIRVRNTTYFKKILVDFELFVTLPYYEYLQMMFSRLVQLE